MSQFIRVDYGQAWGRVSLMKREFYMLMKRLKVRRVYSYRSLGDVGRSNHVQVEFSESAVKH